ncbi:MAG: DUF7282 domain-containing protein [Minisyncoccota bacterium]
MTKRFPEHFSMSSFVAGVMLGALVAGGWLLGGNFPFVPPPPAFSSSLQSLQAASTSPATSSSGALSVADQSAGDTVAIESATVPPPGVWVAVREMQGSDLGNVLGAVLVSGPRSNFSVPLLRATEPGRPYAVELYRDDTNGTFNFAKDSVYVDFDTGAPVIAYFKTVR